MESNYFSNQWSNCLLWMPPDPSSLVLVCWCKIVHTSQCVWMFCTKDSTACLHDLKMQLLCLCLLSLVLVCWQNLTPIGLIWPWIVGYLGLNPPEVRRSRNWVCAFGIGSNLLLIQSNLQSNLIWWKTIASRGNWTWDNEKTCHKHELLTTEPLCHGIKRNWPLHMDSILNILCQLWWYICMQNIVQVKPTYGIASYGPYRILDDTGLDWID